MVWWQRAACPVRPVEQEWVDRSMDWFVAQFGADRLRGEVILPNDDYFPGSYRGTRADIKAVFGRVCDYMGIDADRVRLEHEADETNPDLSAHVPIHLQSVDAAGHYRVHNGRQVVTVRDGQAAEPMALVATVAHELGHCLLLGDGLISTDREDHEPLTDLLTVFFGLGIFSANATFQFAREVRGDYEYARTTRLGYLTEPMYGYGLARYAWLRGETDPPWARFLNANPRVFLKRGLRYLAQTDRLR